ncbi:MAG: glycosyltransferase family 2 protein, partial [Myxococcota bacterium]
FNMGTEPLTKMVIQAITCVFYEVPFPQSSLANKESFVMDKRTTSSTQTKSKSKVKDSETKASAKKKASDTAVIEESDAMKETSSSSKTKKASSKNTTKKASSSSKAKKASFQNTMKKASSSSKSKKTSPENTKQKKSSSSKEQKVSEDKSTSKHERNNSKSKKAATSHAQTQETPKPSQAKEVPQPTQKASNPFIGEPPKTPVLHTQESLTLLDPTAPEVSVVIPVYNEESIITSSIEDLIRALRAMDFPTYEIILAENGSQDATTMLAKNLSSRFPEVRLIHVNEPNYGKALRIGILEARGKYVICDEIDLCDTQFYSNAMGMLRSKAADMVVGSKLLDPKSDNRGWLRNTASKVLNQMLRVAVGFEGTDTHGLKAFRRDKILRLVEACEVDKDLFASELVIRVWRSPSTIKEIPLKVEEKRKPSINLFRRVPNVMKNMGRLVWLFRIRNEN